MKTEDIGRDYVLGRLNDLGFSIKKLEGKRSLFSIQLGNSEIVRIKIQSAAKPGGIDLGNDLKQADIFALVRADDPQNLRAYVFHAEYIARTKPTKESPKDSAFQYNTGSKNPAKVGYWARDKWCFCKEEFLDAWPLIDKMPAGDAINDLDVEPIGIAVPERMSSNVSRYPRDEKVREAVRQRANGRCEHCGVLGFLMSKDTHYVETHHIISLAEQGPDTLENVIALCPNHHREAHYGLDREQLESEFKTKLATLRGK